MNNSLLSLTIDEHLKMPGAFIVEFTGIADYLVPNTMDGVLCFANGPAPFHN